MNLLKKLWTLFKSKSLIQVEINTTDRQHVTNSGKPKVAYVDLAAAQAACQRIMDMSPTQKLSPYVCRVCGRFHIGNDPNLERRARKAAIQQAQQLKAQKENTRQPEIQINWTPEMIAEARQVKMDRIKEANKRNEGQLPIWVEHFKRIMRAELGDERYLELSRQAGELAIAEYEAKYGQ